MANPQVLATYHHNPKEDEEFRKEILEMNDSDQQSHIRYFSKGNLNVVEEEDADNCGFLPLNKFQSHDNVKKYSIPKSNGGIEERMSLNKLSENGGNGGNEDNNSIFTFKRLNTVNSDDLRKKKRRNENDIIHEEVKKQIDELTSKSERMEEAIDYEVEKQHLYFLERKKSKKQSDQKLQVIHEAIISERRQSRRQSKVRRGSKFDILIDSFTTGKNINIAESEIMKDILEYSEKQMKMNQEKMQNEIDDFSNKNVKEMNDTVEEIMFSYTEDMKDIDENVFPEIIDELKNDMQIEIDSVKERYSELRTGEIEKIKAKYLKE